MPTYEYACKNCGEHLEVVQSFKDEPLTECPNCGGTLRKVFGNIGIAFKGSGFYRTDSRSDAKSPVKAEAKAAEGTKSESSSSGSETKTAASSSSGDAKPSSSTSSPSPSPTPGKAAAAS